MIMIRLHKRIPAGQGDSVQKSGPGKLVDQVIHGDLLAGSRIPGVGILAAGAVMRAALEKDDITDSGAVHGGVSDRARDPGRELFIAGYICRIRSGHLSTSSLPQQRFSGLHVSPAPSRVVVSDSSFSSGHMYNFFLCYYSSRIRRCFPYK